MKNIENQTVTSLAPTASKNLTFSWNTTGVTPCLNYTVWAEASVVPGEIDTADNIFIDGKVHVKIAGGIAGDIDGDGDVDFDDFILFAASYGTSVGESFYNPEADLDNDDDVDFDDFIIFAGNYGKTC